MLQDIAEQAVRDLLRDFSIDQVSKNTSHKHILTMYCLEVTMLQCFTLLDINLWQVHCPFGALQDNVEQAVRDLLRDFSKDQGLKEVDTVWAEEQMDDGTPIRLAVTIDRKAGSALLDFEGALHMLCMLCLTCWLAMSLSGQKSRRMTARPSAWLLPSTAKRAQLC